MEEYLGNLGWLSLGIGIAYSADTLLPRTEGLTRAMIVVMSFMVFIIMYPLS